MTGRLVADNLAVQVEFVQAVMRYDSNALWASINANHMLPAGSSLFHPHVQSSVDPVPSTVQQLLAGIPEERFQDYLQTEKRLGERYPRGALRRVAHFRVYGALPDRTPARGELEGPGRRQPAHGLGDRLTCTRAGADHPLRSDLL